MVKKAEEIDQIKSAGTMKVVGIVAAAVAAIFMTGLSTHIQKLFGG
jgi:hypothetical protein